MKLSIQNLIKHLSSTSKVVIAALALGLVILIGGIDYLISVDISLSIFYLVPIIIVTWFIDKKGGIVFSIICTFVWLYADLFAKVYPIFVLPYWNAGVRLGFFLMISYLFSEIKEAYEREKFFASTDGLTGAVNGRVFRDILYMEFNRCNRYHHQLTLAYFDVDNFKKVNDQLGHSKGDYLLKLITKTIQGEIRQTDTLCRIGGDEFSLLLPETNYDQAEVVLNRIREQLLITIELEKLPIGFSIGALTYGTAPESVDQALEQVDNLMYTVKNSGKNRLNHQFFSLSNDK